MNYQDIDAIKSIEKEQIIFKKKSATKINEIFEPIFGFVFLQFISGFIIYLQITKVEYREYLLYGILIFIITLILGVIFVRSNIKRDKLIRLKIRERGASHI